MTSFLRKNLNLLWIHIFKFKRFDMELHQNCWMKCSYNKSAFFFFFFASFNFIIPWNTWWASFSIKMWIGTRGEAFREYILVWAALLHCFCSKGAISLINFLFHYERIVRTRNVFHKVFERSFWWADTVVLDRYLSPL